MDIESWLHPDNADSRPALLLGQQLAELPALRSATRPWPAGTIQQAQLLLAAVQNLPTRGFGRCLIADPLPANRAAEADAVLARVRDLLAERVLVITHNQDALATRLQALGYRILGRTHDQLAAGFDIHDYKHCPTWLNARHWANPQLWDQFRW